MVLTLRFRVERLASHHDRAAFSCGEESLDAYLRQRARTDDERNVAKVFVLYDSHDQRVAGYYTLSASAVHLQGLPLETRRALPRYPLVPAVLIGRLAIDHDYRNQGLGAALLIDALRVAFEVGTRQIAATVVIVDALHDSARSFYERYGFQRFRDNEDRLFLAMKPIGDLLKEGGASRSGGAPS
jgi:GNAT superfamily N-acetyltransferase